MKAVWRSSKVSLFMVYTIFLLKIQNSQYFCLAQVGNASQVMAEDISRAPRGYIFVNACFHSYLRLVL